MILATSFLELAWIALTDNEGSHHIFSKGDPFPPITPTPLSTETSLTLGRIYAAHYPKVYYYHLKRIGNTDEAADLAQETFVKAARYFDTFPEGIVTACVYGIARQTLINYFRRENRFKFDPFEPELLSHPDEDTEDLGLRVQINQTLAQLPPRQRRTIVLVDYLGLSYAEAGEVLGMKTPNVNYHLARGRERFQLLWNDHIEETPDLLAA